MEQETNYGEQSTSGKKRKMPVIIEIASAMVVIAILCVAVISANLNKKDRNNNIDEHVQNIINEITKSPDYVSSIASLGIYDDFNDDGVKELLLTYKTNLPSAGYRVTYSLMQIGPDGGEIIREDTLYEERGGNSGYCGVTEYNGKKYFAFAQKIPNDSGYFEDINLFPWDSSGEKLTIDGAYHLECAVNIDTGNGVFIWGDQKISREEYEAKKNEMSWIYKLTPDVGPDPGNSVSFDELLAVNDR